MYRKNQMLIVMILFSFFTWANANTIDLICTNGKLCPIELQKIVDSNQAHNCCNKNSEENNSLTDKFTTNKNSKCGDFSSKFETYIMQDLKSIQKEGIVTDILILQSIQKIIVEYLNFLPYQTKFSNPPIYLINCSFLS